MTSNKILIVIVYVIIFYNSSYSQNIAFSSVKWKDIFIVEYFSGMKEYTQRTLPTCFDHDRDLFFDMSRKMRAINKYPLDKIIEKINLYIKAEKVEYDSIYMFTSLGPTAEEAHKESSTVFYFFIENKIESIAIGYLFDKFKLYEKQLNKNEFYNALIKRRDGCGYGYYIFTKLEEDSKWKIVKIVINPDDTM